MVIGGGGRFDRAACRDMPRGGARETERDRFCSSEGPTVGAVEGGLTWLIVFLGACALPL